MKHQLFVILLLLISFFFSFSPVSLATDQQAWWPMQYCERDISKGVNTALGCIKIESGDDLVITIFRFAIGIGGGLALALILYGVFIVTTSAGIPDKLKAGNEIITSAIIGLIFILLSIFLFKLIGYNILGIPGLT